MSMPPAAPIARLGRQGPAMTLRRRAQLKGRVLRPNLKKHNVSNNL